MSDDALTIIGGLIPPLYHIGNNKTSPNHGPIDADMERKKFASRMLRWNVRAFASKMSGDPNDFCLAGNKCVCQRPCTCSTRCHGI